MIVPLVALASSLSAPIANLQPVSFTDVKLRDQFWAPKQKVNQDVSIPHTFKMCEETPRMQNFDRVIQGSRTGHEGYVFDDSDVYKSLEAAAYSLATNPNPVLDKKCDAWIAKIAAAQMPDGYIDTNYQLGKIDRRFTNLADDHELYCAGHLFEAAVAHYQATGKKSLLHVATKLADLLVRTFGEGAGKRMGYPGHPECELALVKLWRVTGNSSYFDLAKFFVMNRGQRFFATEKHVPKDSFDGTYWLDDIPITQHNEIKGHAVRAAYLFSGAADVASVTKDSALQAMLDRVWTNTVTKRVFVTGGIGPSGSNEGFTVDYDLPNESAYQETCASVAMAMWNHRMGLLEGRAKYWDWVERSLYNGFLSGVSQSGDRFYYTNPLASQGNHHRQAWFGCACCPPNVTRTLASLGQYLYAKSDSAFYVNLYAQSEIHTKIGAQPAQFDVKTSFPWSGDITFEVKKALPKAVALHFRVPGWCPGFKVWVNGKSQPAQTSNGYVSFDRSWKKGDTVKLSLAMPVQRLQAHPDVKDDQGLTAFQRGPIIYCFEGVDQKGADLGRTSIPIGQAFAPVFDKALFGGNMTLVGKGQEVEATSWKGRLYQPVSLKTVALKAIPYYLWDNRGSCKMEIWVPNEPQPSPKRGLEAVADVSLSHKTNLCDPAAIKDGKPIAASNKHPGNLTHFWPQKGTEEWVAYTWKTPQWISSSRVYWFDDTGAGECRPPASWSLEYLAGNTWKPLPGNYSTELNRWIEIAFPPVETTSIRLKMQLQKSWSVGVHEWQVFGPED